MTRLLLLCLLVFSVVSGYSQERTPLQGKILTHDFEMSSINIINLSSEMGTTNNEKGEFEIPVTFNDTLLFSSVQYEPYEVVITDEVLKMVFLNVLLVEKIDELKEVSISDINLSGNLTTDLENIPTLTQADIGFPISDVPRPTSIERKLYTASSGFDGFLNTLNGKIKMLKKAEANEDISQIVDRGEAALPVSFFTELAIPGNRIRDFIYYCAEDPEFSSLLPDDRRLELVEYYQIKAPEFLKDRL